LKAYSDGFKTGRQIVDIASKYHHIDKWNSIARYKDILCTRPPISNQDISYNKRHLKRAHVKTATTDEHRLR